MFVNKACCSFLDFPPGLKDVFVDHLLGSSLDGAVLAGHILAVPVVCCTTGQAEVGVALSHCQIAGALLGVTLGFAPTTWETVLTCIHEAGRRCGNKRHGRIISVFSMNKMFLSPKHSSVCVLTLRATLAELFTEVLSGDAGTGGVTGLPWMVTWLVIIHMIGRTICTRKHKDTGVKCLFSNQLFSTFYQVKG